MKDTTRESSLIGIEAWSQGELVELKKWMQFDSVKYCFVSENGLVTLFYEDRDYLEFYTEICNKLAGGFFLDRLEGSLDESAAKGRVIMRKEFLTKADIEGLYEIMIKCWPAITMSYEATTSSRIKPDEETIARLVEIRKKGEFLYEAEAKILKSVAKMFPELVGFESVVSIEELRGGRLPSRGELEARKKRYIRFDGILETGKSFSEFLEERDFEVRGRESESPRRFEGRTAMGGKFIGRVKIVLREEDVEKVKKGDVLVAHMTTPDHVVAMERAGAFVTDEGGITCHAAIVAREFGKPCIVGTEIATKVLKDNDLVFVDADAGFVEKINL